MKLFHVSEEHIEVFHPRPAPQAWPSLSGSYVWAIEETVLPNYLLPRECPRICLRTCQGATKEDLAALMLGESSPLVVLEERWRSTIENTLLYVYEFSPERFQLLDDSAGYWISEHSEKPVRVEETSNLIAKLTELGVRVYFRAELIDLGKRVADSSLRFSLIRMKNAGGV